MRAYSFPSTESGQSHSPPRGREVYTASTLLTLTRNVVMESDLQSLGLWKSWLKWQDLNLRQLHYERRALPLSYISKFVTGIEPART